MCGIFGTKNINVDPEIVKKSLSHRGPDAFGLKAFSDWTFYHTRLSILDLSDAGLQPMEYEGNYLRFNGEIYNYKELQKQYLSDVRLISSSDTEVLLHLLIKYGLSILNKLNGMFAFAYFDGKTRNTYLVRDRYGVKPLYYWKSGNTFAFSSVDFSLVNVLNLPYEFNDEYKQCLIENAYSDNSEYSLVKNVFQVVAGSYVKITPNNLLTKHQWYLFSDVQCAITNYSEKNTVVEYFEELLTDSIRLRNRSDVPVGITLSGGLDSSIIYTLAKEKLNAKYKIFTYSNAKKELDEFDKVKRLTSDYGDEVIKIDQTKDTLDIFKKSLFYLNGPIWAPSHIGYFNVYKAIKDQGIKVILEGHGADELLGGWPWTLTNAVKEAFGRGKFYLAYDVFKVQQRTYNQDLNQKSNGGFKNFLKIIRKTKIKDRNCFSELLDTLFSKTILPINLRCWDRLSMANSVESRCPFLDYRIVEFLKRLPIQYKVNKIGNKAILRDILLKYHKDYIVENKVKLGYLSSEINFLNENSDYLLKYYDERKFDLDVSSWKTGSLDYSYNSKVYRIIALNILQEIYRKGQLDYL